MGMINKTLPFPELDVRPPLEALIDVRSGMDQALSLLCGYDESERRLLRCSQTGVIYTARPRTSACLNVLSTGVGYTYQGGNVPTNEVMIKTNSNNGGDVWVNIDTGAAVDSGWQLAAGAVLIITLSNLNNLHLYFANDTDKVSVLYSR